MHERIRRMARAASLTPTEHLPTQAVILANSAFTFDPLWFAHILKCPSMVLTYGGIPTIAYAPNAEAAERLAIAMETNTPISASEDLQIIAFEDNPTLENKRLRKRETPFLIPLTSETIPQLERASYQGAYKGVTDILTKYLWPEWAFTLTRQAAQWGISPNMVTSLGAILCLSATIAFAYGSYWLGLLLGLGFMVLDTVDGKLARCTITSSAWGNIFDHGIDLIHPPFWWWFWATGLSSWGLAYSPETFRWVLGTILIGYVVQRLTEGTFIRTFKGVEIHVWQKFDSNLRLITARRNPNMVILFVSLLFSRPDLGLIAVALWTGLCCILHLIRLAMAFLYSYRGNRVISWLSDAPR